MTQFLPHRHYRSVELLTEATPFLGATAGQWDKALTGNFQETLKVVHEKAIAAGRLVAPYPTTMS